MVHVGKYASPMDGMGADAKWIVKDPLLSWSATVDDSEIRPSPVKGVVVYPIFCRFLCIPAGWPGISQPSTVSLLVTGFNVVLVET